MRTPLLTQFDLRRMLHYCEETGIFTWRVRDDVRPQWNGRYAGKRAGYEWTASGGKRYRSIRIYDWPFAEHRLAHLYVTGKFPTVLSDHQDQDGTNNKWANLREATRFQNSGNAGAWKNNKLGVRGVCLFNGRYRATIRAGGKQRYLGVFRTQEEAEQAYATAARDVYGEFAAVQS